MRVDDFWDPCAKSFIGKRRVTGIFQTGKRLYVKNNTELDDELLLKRDYDNAYDDCAVCVYDKYNVRIGYIEQRYNDDIAFFMDSGYECYGIVSDIDKNAVTIGILLNVYCRCDNDEYEDLLSRYKDNIRIKTDELI